MRKVVTVPVSHLILVSALSVAGLFFSCGKADNLEFGIRIDQRKNFRYTTHHGIFQKIFPASFALGNRKILS